MEPRRIVPVASIELEFSPDEIRFLSYRYPPAAVFPSGVVRANQVRDADPDGFPPEIRLPSGETLFVPAVHREDLRQFCERNDRPIVRRPDLWGALLEPFVDTEFAERDDHYTRELLLRHGLSRAEIAGIRGRFELTMVAYNIESGLWDWVHLGLDDLLDALLGHRSGEQYRLPTDEFAETYRWAMELADRRPGGWGLTGCAGF